MAKARHVKRMCEIGHLLKRGAKQSEDALLEMVIEEARSLRADDPIAVQLREAAATAQAAAARREARILAASAAKQQAQEQLAQKAAAEKAGMLMMLQRMGMRGTLPRNG